MRNETETDWKKRERTEKWMERENLNNLEKIFCAHIWTYYLSFREHVKKKEEKCIISGKVC